MDDLYDPAGLPDVDVVEVVRLDPDTEAAGRPVRLAAGEAGHVADLWRRLPPGKQMRCHDPAYTLRFFGLNKLLAEGSVCWDCHNIHVTWAGRHATNEFDAGHNVSRQLLAECRRAAGGR